MAPYASEPRPPDEPPAWYPVLLIVAVVAIGAGIALGCYGAVRFIVDILGDDPAATDGGPWGGDG